MLPSERVLIVENESCQHQLPSVPNTIAVLGAGFDLSWTEAEWLARKKIAYWGDIDTWGLHFLAKARLRMARSLTIARSELGDRSPSQANRPNNGLPVANGNGLPEWSTNSVSAGMPNA